MDYRDERIRVRVNTDGEIGTFLARRGVQFAKDHYVLSSMYLLGVVLMVFATGFAVTEEQANKFEATVSGIDLQKMARAEMLERQTYQVYYESKGWFSCDEVCEAAKAKYHAAVGARELLEQQAADTYSEAKKGVGIMSEYGVQEVRDLFWAQFAGGRDFAKRSSWWDLIFMGIGSMGRDESLMEFAIRFLFQMLMNFTIGMIGALVGFYWYLWSVITTYQPGVVVGFLSFFLASVAATSLVASYLIAIYSAAAGSVYVAVKVGENSARRLENEARRQQEYIRAHHAHNE